MYRIILCHHRIVFLREFCVIPWICIKVAKVFFCLVISSNKPFFCKVNNNVTQSQFQCKRKLIRSLQCCYLKGFEVVQINRFHHAQVNAQIPMKTCAIDANQNTVLIFETKKITTSEKVMCWIAYSDRTPKRIFGSTIETQIILCWSFPQIRDHISHIQIRHYQKIVLCYNNSKQLVIRTA